MACPCPPLDDAVIAAHAYAAGFRGQALAVAVAIALRESGGRACCSGDEALQTAEWGPSIGLWQVRTLKAETGKGTPRDINRLQQGPTEQAVAAFTISSGGRSWQPWSTARQGIGPASPQMGRARTAAAAVESGVATGTPVNAWTDAWDTTVGNARALPGNAARAGADAAGLGGVLDAFSTINDTLKALTSRETLTRVAKMLGGILAIVLGLAVVFRDSLATAGRAAASAAVVA